MKDLLVSLFSPKNNNNFVKRKGNYVKNLGLGS